MHPAQPRLFLLAVAFLLSLSPFVRAETAATTNSAQDIPSEKGCAVCGMYPAHYPDWQQQIVFKDKSMAAFDGGKCMFRFLLDIGRYDGRHTAADIAMIWVKDFETGAWIDGTKAAYVVGSSVLGPMGKEIIPFASQEAARKFQQQKGGTVELYTNITLATLKPLMGGMMQMHQGGHQPAHGK